MTCTNASVRISARSRRVFGPQTFPLPTSFSRFYAHLRAPVWRHRVSPTRAVGEQDQTAPLLSRPGLHKRRARRRVKRVIHPLAGVARRRAVSKIPWYFPCFSLIYRARARGRVLRRERPGKSALTRPRHSGAPPARRRPGDLTGLTGPDQVRPDLHFPWHEVRC